MYQMTYSVKQILFQLLKQIILLKSSLKQRTVALIMIEIHNVSYILKQDKRKQQSSHLNSQNNQTQKINTNYIMKIYTSSNKQYFSQNIQVVEIKLKKCSSEGVAQNVLQQQDPRVCYKIKDSEEEQYFNKKYTFQLCTINSLTHQYQSQCVGQLDFGNKFLNYNKWTAFDSSRKQFVHGFLSCNYNLYSKDNQLINKKQQKLTINIFSLKVLFYNPNYKRALLTISKNKNGRDFRNNQELDQQNQELHMDQNSQNQKVLPIRRLQKGWISYRDILQLQLQLTQKNPDSDYIEIKAFSFDYNTCSKEYIGSFRGLVYLNFRQNDEVKYTELDIFNYKMNNDEAIGKIQLKYCLQSQSNSKKISDMISRTFRQNAFSPSKFVYDNTFFVSSSNKFTEDSLSKSTITDRKFKANNSVVLNSSRVNRNIFAKSKFHSILSPNNGIAIDRQQRFKVPKKKLTDQLGYYAHKTLDINYLPTNQKYRYASFGKDKKQCLKEWSFHCAGPGSGGLKLPSLFDKYA